MLERAKSLINDALSLGCIAALQKHDHNVKCLTDPIREKYIDLIDLQPSDDVLEIGSSMGQHTRRIAAKCRSVNALEVIKFQAEFSKIWCGQEGLQNVHFTAGGASGHLPYENSSFDVVISNYVLEWCAGRAAGDPNEFHKEVLSEIWRVLKPGGRLFLSTKNRFAFKYLTGVEDEHLGIRFGSALPRWIQKRAAATARLGHPTGYLHSWAGLRADLIAAGFKNLVPLFAFPDARWPVFLGRAQDFSRSNITSPEGINFGKRDRALAVLPSQTRLALSNSIIYLADR
ncbi:MAG: class I SAM-dependent methyltransferase [Aestuariivirga sp.]|nr:class I SAM-dependent methyltransferase [Aestuariivirga sp.]